jgi:hypothetical protein
MHAAFPLTRAFSREKNTYAPGRNDQIAAGQVHILIELSKSTDRLLESKMRFSSTQVWVISHPRQAYNCCK